MQEPKPISTDTGQVEEVALETRSFLIFECGPGLFGVPVLETHEILTPVRVTRLPNVESEVIGVINMRGNIIPVVDLNRKLGRPYTQPVRSTRIVVADMEGKYLGLLVDRVHGVTHITASDLSAIGLAERDIRDISTDYVTSVGRSEHGVFLALNVSALAAAGLAGSVP